MLVICRLTCLDTVDTRKVKDPISAAKQRRDRPRGVSKS